MRVFSILLAVLLPAGCFWSEPKPAPNEAPVINAILVNGERVELPKVREGDKVSLGVVVWDPNGDGFGPEAFRWAAEDGTLDSEQGSSVVWEAPRVDWQSVQGDVFVTVSVEVSDGEETVEATKLVQILPPCRADNHAPVIRAITADPPAIKLGESTTITADVEDPDGDPIVSYDWTVPFGNIHGSGASIVWETTDTCCTDDYVIQLIVSDGCTSTWGKTTVRVNVD